MSKVFVNIGLSLDGYMAPEGMTIENWDKPRYENWGAKWGALLAWAQYLNLGAVDDLEIALSPVLFGGGRRLFENLREAGPQFRIDKFSIVHPATHARYARR